METHLSAPADRHSAKQRKRERPGAVTAFSGQQVLSFYNLGISWAPSPLPRSPLCWSIQKAVLYVNKGAH